MVLVVLPLYLGLRDFCVVTVEDEIGHDYQKHATSIDCLSKFAIALFEESKKQ
jgi:hypothetical protein